MKQHKTSQTYDKPDMGLIQFWNWIEISYKNIKS